MRARPKKGFVERKPIMLEEIIKEKERVETITTNQKSTRLEMGTLRLIIALGLYRTSETFGTLHYCKCHDKLVDKTHINECSLLNVTG